MKPENEKQGSGIEFKKIKSIKTLEEQHVYDLSIEGTRNFIANDIVAHNTAVLPYVNTSGLVGLYHFNNETGENASLVKDWSVEVNNERSSSPYNNGTITNGATHENGKFRKGVQLDGISVKEQVNLSNPDSLYVPNFTLMAWIYPTAFDDNAYHTILADYNTDATKANFDFAIWRSGVGADALKPYIFIADNAGGTSISTGATILNNSEWYFVAATYDNDRLKIYLNGVLDSNTATTRLPSNQGGDVTIGRGGSFDGNYFIGSIDEVSVWNRTLSANEVSNLYKRGAIQLNLSVRSCSDNTCSGNVAYQNFTNNITSGRTIPLNLSANRYFQYNLTYSRNATGLNATVIINNLTIKTNSTAIFTDSFGNYNYTLTAPSTSGSYTVKVNSTWANTIPGESLQTLSVSNNPTTRINVGSAFIIQNNTGATFAYLNSTGGLFLVGMLTQNVLFS